MPDVFLPPKEYVISATAMERHYSVAESEAYTKWLATKHYENFHVVSFLLPKHLHRDFYNVYSFCRWADDLGDEIGDPKDSLRLLSWWRAELQALYRGEASHPVYISLIGTLKRHPLPIEPFDDLITAFVLDQTTTRYPAYADVFNYCRYSANPVGRLVLHLCGYHDAGRQAFSDKTCTALQLANFWQDVSVDLLKDRVYIPLEVLHRHGYSVEDLFKAVEDTRFQQVMREVVARARELFEDGLPLVEMVDRKLALDIDLFSRGGLYILDKIERQDYKVLVRRPAVSKPERILLLFRSLIRVAFQRAA